MKSRYVTLLLILLLSSALSAQNLKFQALFVFNFAKNITWPTSYKSGDFIIGVYGNEPEIIIELKKIAQKRKIGSQPIVVIKLNNTNKITKCHILYITRGKSRDITEINLKTKSAPMLIITDKEGLNGACINFIDNDFDLEYEINTRRIRKRGMTIVQSLIELGIEVSD